MMTDPVFLSHGSPMLALEDSPAASFLRQLGPSLGKPSAVVVVSAHWPSSHPLAGGAATPATIHDFHGFPEPLYRLRYPAPGHPQLAQRVAALVGGTVDPSRGLDHGVWCPAGLIWPEADLPLVPLSIQPDRDPGHHYRLGMALRPLVKDGVLVLASGALTHNLRAYFGHEVDDPAEPATTAFVDWFTAAAAEGRVDDLLAYRRRAPFAVANHPTDEHLLPFFVALGAAAGQNAEVLHHSIQYGVLAMDAYRFRSSPSPT